MENLVLFHYLRVGRVRWRPVLRKLVRSSIQFDVVVAHSWPAIEIAQRVGAAQGLPFVAALHSSDLDRLERINGALREAAGVVFRAPWMQRVFEQRTRIQRPSFVAVSGIPEDEIDEAAKAHKCSEPTQEPLRIAFAGRLLSLKNVDVTLRALSRLRGKFGFSFHIIGDGPDRQRLESLAGKLGLSDVVVFHGHLPRSEVLASLADADVFAMASAPETFGLVYLEAMARGAVVIGAKDWGIDGVVKDGQNGYLVEPGNVDEMGQALLRTTDTVRRAELRKAAFETVANLTAEKVATRYLDFIRQVADGRARAASENQAPLENAP